MHPDIVGQFDALRALVRDAGTKKEHALKWSGPRDHPMTKSDHDIRRGGKWRACRQGADGRELWQSGVHKQVVPQQKLVFTFGWNSSFDRLADFPSAESA